MAEPSAAEAAAVPPEKGTPEYNEAMTQRFEKGFNEGETKQTFEVPPAEITPMPENGHDKFYNKETGQYSWENHSKELQYRLDQNPKKDAGAEEAKDASSSAVDWDVISDKLGTSQNLEESDFEKLTGMGIPREVIESYIELLETGNEAAQAKTIEYAGGQESIDQMFGWAQQNLTEDEIGNYNSILASTNWRMAVDSLRVAAGMAGSSTAEDAGAPQLMEGASAPASGTGFASSQEMISAMSDPKYKSDPAFRNQVRLRVGRSNF